MNATEKINKVNEINAKYECNYQVGANGRVFSIFMGKKQYTTIESLINHYEGFEMAKTAKENAKQTVAYIQGLGYEGKMSMYGTYYFIIKGKTVRVADHFNTTEKYTETDYNLFNNQKDGFVEMIEKVNTIE